MNNDYELILMDCDMPVMNGFEAAARIRNNEAFSHSRIPIIALTSYDREGDREKCIAAGMDDYITKGASRKELKETIERSIVSAREKSQGMGGEDLEEDLPPLDLDSLLKLYGKEEVEEISKLFLSNMGTYIECMQLAIDEKDAESVVHFSNAVKGPCAALGIKLMTRLTTDIITFAEEGDWTQVRVKYMRLKAVFVQTREKLKKICPDDSLMAT
ncbi:MAG: response regulator [Candidatus Melainabacteria bacterium]|nr:response regulator [Candidatus Melainabacteria bacterium]